MYHLHCHPLVGYLLSVEVYGKTNLTSTKLRGDFHPKSQILDCYHIWNGNSFHDYQLLDTHLNLQSTAISCFGQVYLFFYHQRDDCSEQNWECIVMDDLVCGICLDQEVDDLDFDTRHCEGVDDLAFDTHHYYEGVVLVFREYLHLRKLRAQIEQRNLDILAYTRP